MRGLLELRVGNSIVRCFGSLPDDPYNKVASHFASGQEQKVVFSGCGLVGVDALGGTWNLSLLADQSDSHITCSERAVLVLPPSAPAAASWRSTGALQCKAAC